MARAIARLRLSIHSCERWREHEPVSVEENIDSKLPDATPDVDAAQEPAWQMLLPGRTCLREALRAHRGVPLRGLGRLIIYCADTHRHTVFFDWGCPRVRIAGRAFLAGSVILLALLTLEEASQMFIPARRFDWVDLLFDFLGVWVFGRVAIAAHAKTRKTILAAAPASDK
ncbi:MAG: hypothetical protein AB1705_02320 [Verrucomicrobiota bacterium]